MPKKIVLSIVLIAIILGIVVYYTLDPSEVFFPRCPFYSLTGLKCPGCGTQRAIHQLLHHNLAGAVRYNALMVFSIPLLVFFVVADVCKTKWPKLYLLARNPILSWSILAIVLLWWILWNILSL